MAKLIGIDDKSAVEVKCPNCGKILQYVSTDAQGHLYPFCKMCRKNVVVYLPSKKN